MTNTKHAVPFYGWLIVLIAALGGFIVAGIGYAAFGQFIRPLSQAFGWSVGVIALASTVRLLTSIVIAPWVGRLTDRIGPRVIMATGALITGAAYLSLYSLTNPLVFYLSFTVGVSVGFSLLGGIPAQAIVTRWFRRRRGLALSLLSIGNSMGGVVIVPLVQLLLGQGDWRGTFAIIGASILLVLLPLAALLLRNDPEMLGLQPDGDLTADAPTLQLGVRLSMAIDKRSWTMHELWLARDFRRLALGLLFASTLYTLIEVFQFPILTARGLDGNTAALFISVYSFCAGASKFVWGYLADRVDLRRLVVAAIWLNAFGLALLVFADSLPLFWLYTTISGTGGGGHAALTPALIAQRFGRRSYGTVAGLLVTVSLIAPAIAVPLAGFVYDATQTYALVFLSSAACA
jgi:sugar phosphate permease